MAKGMKDFVAEAKRQIGEVEPAEAHRAAGEGRALLLDVREPGELSSEGALGLNHRHVPRGLLEAKADPESGACDEGLTAARNGRQVHVFCASGARAAMAAARLKEMGYDAHVVSGGFAAWRDAGLPVKRDG